MVVKKSRRWCYWVLGTIFLSIFLVVSLNYLVDTYGIFRIDFKNQVVEPNQHFLKARYIAFNPKKFDSFVFGSSRVNAINVSKLKNGKWYNMTYSEGLPAEHLRHLRFFKERGVEIKNVLIGLDDFSYKIDPKTHFDQMLRQPYPPTIGESALNYYIRYLIRLPDKKVLKSTLQAYQDRKKGVKTYFDHYDFYNTGRGDTSFLDEKIEQNPEQYRNDERFKKPSVWRGNRIKETLEEIKAIVDFCKTNKINLVIFINPHHHNTYLNSNLPQFFYFKKELAKITDYYDFSGLNSITTDNYYFYETSHYRTIVGDMMLKRIFGYPDVKVPDDFGVKVTKENIDEHLKRQKEEVKKYTNALNS